MIYEIQTFLRAHVSLKRAVYGLVAIAALCLLSLPLWAHGHDHGGDTSTVTNNYYGDENHSSSGNNGSNDDNDKGVATALSAGSCMFDWSKGIQGCGAVGYYEDQSAVSFQVGKRVDDLLLNGGVACDTDFDTCGYTGAVNFHF